MTLAHDRSAAIFREAVTRMPGGVSSPVRAFAAVGGEPPIIARADGPYVFDVDGNRYIDLVMAYGPHILGHKHPAIQAALAATLERGTAFGMPTEDEVALARLVEDLFPSIEMVRFVCSGTEATMSAVRLARAATSRQIVVKFEGSYHGHADFFLSSAGSGMATQGLPSSPGVPEATTATVVVLPDFDLDALNAFIDSRGDEVAAIIAEPVPANFGVLLPPAGWLEGLRAAADRCGAILIFDEVITGFRLAPGGAQERFGVRADLTCLGKIIGGGLPVGAYGGRRDLMAQMAPSGPVYQAGTLAGSPLAMQAGAAALTELRRNPPYERLERNTRRVLNGWLEIAHSLGIPATVNTIASIGTIFFSEEPVENVTQARQADRERFARFHRALLEHGVLLAPSQFEAAFLSTAHDDTVIDALIAAGRSALATLAKEVR